MSKYNVRAPTVSVVACTNPRIAHPPLVLMGSIQEPSKYPDRTDIRCAEIEEGRESGSRKCAVISRFAATAERGMGDFAGYFWSARGCRAPTSLLRVRCLPRSSANSSREERIALAGDTGRTPRASRPVRTSSARSNLECCNRNTRAHQICPRTPDMAARLPGDGQDRTLVPRCSRSPGACDSPVRPYPTCTCLHPPMVSGHPWRLLDFSSGTAPSEPASIQTSLWSSAITIR
jgi:hypothetical protein